jgi:hypothetical protein
MTRRPGLRCGTGVEFQVKRREIRAGASCTNGLNQYTAAGGAAFTYDGNGNLKSDGANTYVYDAENRLVSVSGAHQANLRYDPLGRLYEG